MSAAGGVQHCPGRAAEIGANAFALFTRNQKRWESPPLDDSAISGFRDGMAEFGLDPGNVVPHDSYLINLGNPDPDKRARSRVAFLDELRRTEALGLDLLNFHPGSSLGEISDEECLGLISSEMKWAMSETERVVLVIENTAGQGSAVGHRFEQLAELISRADDRARVGVCLDTCHLFAAGYDLRTRESVSATLDEFDAVVGLTFLKAMHVNDAKSTLGSRVDRHAPLGDGQIGWEGLAALVSDPRLAEVPFILETPEPERWPAEIEGLRALAAAG